jgi:ribosomal protein S4
VDVHLVQLAKRMVACETPAEMAGLLSDRDALLERRLAMQLSRIGLAEMPSLSDTA